MSVVVAVAESGRVVANWHKALRILLPFRLVLPYDLVELIGGSDSVVAGRRPFISSELIAGCVGFKEIVSCWRLTDFI